ncbi:MAG: type II toxin-antitoxin system VapC family toxin [Candidatus Hydrothermarchaeota archaeon]
MKVTVDTNIFLNVINKEPEFMAYSSKILDAIDGGSLTAILSTIVLTELSAGYNQQGLIQEKNAFFSYIITSPQFEVFPPNVRIADRAGEIRAKQKIRLPYAIITATAIESGSECVISNDSEFLKVKNLIDVFGSKEFCELHGLLEI